MSKNTIDALIKFGSRPNIDEADEIFEIIDKVNVDGETDAAKLIKAFNIAKFALRTQSDQFDLIERNLEDDIKDLRQQLKDSGKSLPIRDDKSRELEVENARLEDKISGLRADINELESKLYNEQTEKDKLLSKLEDVERNLAKSKKEIARLEEDNKEYTKKNQVLLDKKYAKKEDDNAAIRDKIRQKNKLIEDLEDENSRLMEDNQKLDNLLQSNKRDLEDAMFQMNKATEDLKKFHLLQEQSDLQMDQYRKEIEILKSQISIMKEQIVPQQTQDTRMITLVDARIKEYTLALQQKDEEIRNLQELVITLRDNLTNIKMDSDKTSVASLTKALQDKDKQIEILKQQIEECTKEMDKSSAIINNLNKNVMQSSRMFSQGGTGYFSKEAEQKIKFLENLLKESESRIREAEEHASDKEKALTEALNRLNEYESGDYQLQQAVSEIKNSKNQIKIRDRDIETLTKHINKIDYALNEVLEENDELRARLGMEPREKINIEELKDLKAVRAQESRAVVHVLQKEIESLEEERIKLKEKIRKLAKIAGSKANVAAFLEDDTDYGTEKPKDLINSKLKELDNKLTQFTSQSGRQPNVEIEDLRRKNEQLLHLQREYQQENQQLEQGLKEINDSLKNVKTTKQKGEVVIQCPTLEKLLNHMETNRVSRGTIRNLALYNFTDVGDGNANHLVLKSEIDYLQGRNEELRTQLIEAKNDLTKNHIQLNKAQEELNRVNENTKGFNKSGLVDTFQILKLPPGMSPSSNDVISALNEYLIDTLQELNEYKRISTIADKDLENLKKKYSIQRHQLSLLYKDYIEENNLWKNEKSNLTNEIQKLNGIIDVSSVKLQEYDRLLKTLEDDEVEVHRKLAESSRETYVHRTNIKQLERKCGALEDLEIKLTKENKKLRTEIIQMEVAVQQRLGYLQRYKEMANFKIMSFQRQLEECVPIQKLEEVNRQYNEVVQNYRQLLEKQDLFESKSEALFNSEEQNKKYSSEIAFLRKELENEKEKSHILEETVEKMRAFSTAVTPRSAKGGKIDESSNISMAKRLAAIEMKEINERQRADFAQRMYDEQRNLLRQVENRNLELENNYAQISKLYLNLQKVEQHLREELSNCIPKAVNDADKQRINQLEKSESSLKIEVDRLKELTEITLYQNEAVEFIHNIHKKELDSIGSIEVLSHDDDKTEVGKLYRQIIALQVSEATAIRKLQNSVQLNKKLETQLLRAEQKLDQERQDTFYMKKEYTSKITYLRSTIQDLRHKYAGSVPLRQQETFHQSKQALLESKKELMIKLKQVDEEKNELEDKIAEYQSRLEGLDILKNLNTTDAYKANEKLLEWHKKMENLRMANLKLERANKRYKDEKKFLEELNRKYEITIVNLEEESIRAEKDFDQKVLIWEHREADLERTIEHLKQQHQYIESLALDFGEISGKMPDPSLPIPNQLEQAMNIIRDHIKLLAEAKVQADFAKKRVTELEEKNRKAENDVTLRDKIIADLRLRLPATTDRDLIISEGLSGSKVESTTPVRAAQSTIEGLQSRLNQKEQTIIKYQELLKLAREEISKLNKQHELEINNLMDKLNNTRDSNLQKIKENLKFTPRSDRIATKSELMRLQELEEINVEQDNTISSLNDKVRKLNDEIDQWKIRYEALIEKFKKEKAMIEHEQQQSIEKLNLQIEEHKDRIREQETEMESIIAELENQKQLNSKSPSNTMKSLVEKLKHQLAEKEEQHKNLTKALSDLRSDMVNIAKNNLLSVVDEQNQVQQLVEKTKETHQDEVDRLEEELVKLRREVKMKTKINEDLTLENEHLNSQIKTKDQKIRKLIDENGKLSDDTKRIADKTHHGLAADIKSNDAEFLRRQIRQLEEKLRRQRPEKPYETTTNNALTQKLKDRIKELENEMTLLKDELKDTKRQAVVAESTKPETQVLFKPDQQLHQKYHYVLNENTILKREKHDLEVEILALKRENEIKSNQLLNENQSLKTELDRLKKVKAQNFTVSKLSSNEDLLSKVDKLNQENLLLKKQLENLKDDSPKNKSKIEEMTKYIELLKSEIEQLKHDNPESISSTSSGNLKRIGESGKSTHELEKMIAKLKKVILKLQQENDALKSNSLN